MVGEEMEDDDATTTDRLNPAVTLNWERQHDLC